MPNADILWNALSQNWPEKKEWLTIEELTCIIPEGTAGIENRSSYDFAILTLLSTIRRPDYFTHEDPAVEKVINDEVTTTNRNNGIWSGYMRSRVARN